MATGGHGHGQEAERVVAPWGRRVALWMIVPLVLATLGGLVLLWPSGPQPQIPGSVRYSATVVSVTPCPPAEAGESASCVTGTLRLEEGPDEGTTIELPVPAGSGAPTVAPGDPVVVSYTADAPAESRYEFADFQRSRSMLVLAALFAAAVLVLSRWRGLAALAALGASILVLTVFLLPALLGGGPPLLVAVVGASAIMIMTLYLSHGPSVRTTVALVGTLLSLALTAVLGAIFTQVGRFTGLADENASYLGAVASDLDFRGLLLAGLVIGALGVLDDVTITQTAAVWEVTAADPTAPRRRVFAAGMRVGRDHVSSTVNTLVLAYAGSALPLLLLFQVSSSRLGDVLTSEAVATEIMRALVGGLGIVAAVPLTTALAALVVAGHHPRAAEEAAPPDPGGRAKHARRASG